jgi:hypothetical protein
MSDSIKDRFWCALIILLHCLYFYYYASSLPDTLSDAELEALDLVSDYK